MLTAPRLPDAKRLPVEAADAGYRYVFPLRNRGELQGLLLLGTRRGEEPLSRDDLHLIGTLTAPVALAIENSRLYGGCAASSRRSARSRSTTRTSSSRRCRRSRWSRTTARCSPRTSAFWELVGADHTDEPIHDALPAVRRAALDDGAR